jgi:hypothetical protein
MSKLRRRILLFVLLGVTMMLLSTGVAMAASTLDQQNTVYADPYNPTGGSFGVDANQRIGQTFTAGISGNLDKVSLYGSLMAEEPLNPAPGDLTVDIFAVDSSGDPTGSSIGYGSVPATNFTPYNIEWFDVPLSQPALISSGTQYALVLASTEARCVRPDDPRPCPGFYSAIFAGSGNPYPGGYVGIFSGGDIFSFNNKDADLAFKTYVSPAPPEVPTTKEQCKNGGWKKFKDESGQPLFKNQGQCIKYVNQANK